MARDPLAVLARMRAAAVTEARRALAAAAGNARAAEEAQSAHGATVLREQADASGDGVADFAAWLPAARARGRELAGESEARAARIEPARAALIARRTEAEAVDAAVARRRAEAVAAAERRERAATDEVAGRRRPGPVPR
jgi:hypothetical protein